MKRINSFLLFGLLIATVITGLMTVSCSLNPFYGVGDPVTGTTNDTNTAPDTQAPVLQIVNPLNNQEVSGILTLVGTVKDSSDISYVKVAFDSSNDIDFVDATVSGGVYSYSWNTSGMSEGSHFICVYAADVKENVSAIETVVFLIDREIPSVTMSQPTNGKYFNQTFNITGTASDFNTINMVQYTLDNTNWVNLSIVESSSVSYSNTIDVTDLSNGQLTVRVRAFDNTGKYGYDARVVTVDKIYPTVTVVSPTNDTTVSTTVLIDASATDNEDVQYMRIKVDGVTIKSNSGDTAYTVFITNTSFEGPHTITVEAFDFAGNKDEDNLTIVINENPATTSGVNFSSSGTGIYLNGTVNVTGTSADTSTVSNVSWKLYTQSTWTMFVTNGGGTSTNWAFDFNTASFSSGTNKIQIKAVDDLGGFVVYSTNVYIDNVGPNVVFINPASDYEVKGGYFTISSYVTDNIAIKEYTLYTNGLIMTNVTSIAQGTKEKYFNSIWDLTPFSDGTVVKIIAEVVDYANQTYTLTNSVIVSNNTPSLTVYTPTTGEYVPASILVTGQAIRAVDGVKNAQVKIDSGSFQDASVNTISSNGETNDFSTTIDASGYNEGNHIITVRAYASNNSYIDLPIPVTLDKTYPSAAISSPTTGKYYGTVTIQGTASDNYGIDTAQLRIETNGVAVWGPANLSITSGSWQTNWDSTTLPVGDIDIILEVADYAGNTRYRTNSITIAPYITSLSVSSTWLSTALVINGYNLGTGTQNVNFNGASTTGTASSTTISLTIPAAAKSGYVSLSVNGVNSINSNWINLWSLIDVNAVANALANSRFTVGPDNKAYFVQASRLGGSPGDSDNTLLYGTTSSAFTLNNFYNGADKALQPLGNSIDVGSGSSSNLMAICYSKNTTGGVWVAVFTNNAGTWVFVRDAQADSTVTMDSTGIALPDVKVDQNGYIHIAYSSYSGGLVKYARSTDKGQNWTVETAVSGVGFETVNFRDAHTSIDVDSAGRPHISYYDNNYGKLRHAWKSGSTWYTETVDTTQLNGNFSSISVDASDGLHVSYYNGDQGDLVYSYKPSGGSWTRQIADYNAITGYYTDIAVSGTEKAISYFSTTYSKCYMAFYDPTYVNDSGNNWRSVQVPVDTAYSLVAYGMYSGVGFTTTGQIWVGFVDGNNSLWVAKYMR